MKSTDLNFNFDTCDDEKCDKYIKNHIERICGEILNSLGSKTVKSIILTGGMTREEGSAVSYGERIEVFSDYDLLVLVNKIGSRIQNELKRISGELTKEFSREGLPSHVDVLPITPKKLSKMNATMFSLELKEYGRSLYGEDHRKYMLDLKAEDIPQEDSLRMLHNRIVGVLECFDPDIFLRKIIRDESKAKFLIYHIAKNIVDLGSSLFSFEKLYLPSYKERVKILKQNFEKLDFAKKEPDFPEVIEKWTEFKLKPDLKRILYQRGYNNSHEDLIKLARELWFEHISYMESVWRYEIQKIYNTKEQEPINLVDIYYRNNSQIKARLKDCYIFIKMKNIFNLSFLAVLANCIKSLMGLTFAKSIYSLSDLLFFYSPEILKKGFFPNKSIFAKYMKKLSVPLSFFGKNSIQAWDDIRKSVVSLWYIFGK